ncbi:MAG: monodechloroaminopyrrolnitrin synthase PrnB family protein [Pseudomonadota bacterium]
MSKNAEIFDDWIRNEFVALNTALEELYFTQDDRGAVQGAGDDIKDEILRHGCRLIIPLVEEGNTDEGADKAFDLLGNLGLYMASLRRHELTNPAREEKSPHTEASALGMHIAASLGMAPRFASSHLATRGRAVNGVPKRFTSLRDERIFVDLNTLGILSVMRAADAVKRILPLGVSHPVTKTLLENAAQALRDVKKHNQALMDDLDIDRFFFCVRPYYKPYRVGRHEYRGANAGDFSGINELDLLLGVCRANNPYYSQLLVDKMLFMPPEDQAALRDAMRKRSLLDEFLVAAQKYAAQPWFKENGLAFLNVCRLFGEIAAQHHNSLVKKFIEGPSNTFDEKQLAQITASGPPLPVLLRSLEVLRDLRLAAPRDDIPSRHADMAKLASLVA